MAPAHDATTGGRAASDARARGFASALAAYVAWGLFPVYFKALAPVPPLHVLAHRIVWSLAFMGLLVTGQRRWRDVRAALRPRQLPAYAATTLLISANWLLFIWAVNAGRVLEASLGYFVNPLVNVLLGRFALGERLRPWQVAAVVLAAAGVLALVLRLGTVPWVSLALALTFGLYGLVRKKAGIDAVVGLLVETALLAPVALAGLTLLGIRGGAVFGPGGRTAALLVGVGVVTAVPLVWFGAGMRSLRLSTMGLIQYVTPTSQFLLAVALYREPFTAAHAVAFGCIWTSLAMYTYDAVVRRPAPPVVPPD